MAKRILLWTGLFLVGVLLGFELAWLLGFLRPASRADSGKASAGESVELTLAGTIDGSDRFIFTRDNVSNEHGKWSPPKDLMFNGLPWPDVTQLPDGWLDFAAPLDLRRATIIAREGRDVVALEATADGFDLYLADTPMGAGQYSVTISIPKK
jgi:hypothetical protein